MPQCPVCQTTYKTSLIGSCSVCSGPVMKTEGSQASCASCGATAKNAYGPTIEMLPKGSLKKAWSDMNEEQQKAALNMGVCND